jgi:TRAP-type mannitol/chloroaromatic compound transport system permease small subunit
VDLILGGLLKVSRFIDRINFRIGKWIAWLVLAAVVVSAVNATVRKVFDTSSNSWLELQWILFSIVFLLCSPWTLLDNEHIRIDIVNNLFQKKVRNGIDIVGHALFLLPLCIVLVVTGIPFARASAPSFSSFFDVLAQFPRVFLDSPLHWIDNLTRWLVRFRDLGEQSSNAGGLPQWPSKALVMIAFTLLFFQGLSELVKRIAVVRGLIPDPYEKQTRAIEAEVEHLVDAIEKR